jgi:hypothetical protein
MQSFLAGGRQFGAMLLQLSLSVTLHKGLLFG